MSELSTGAYAPDRSADDDSSKVSQVAGQSRQVAGQAVSEVKGTAAEQAQRVGAEAKRQARNVAGDVRDRLSEQARTQNDRLVGSIRQTADQLDEMRGERADGPAAAVVSRVADGGRQVADYLDRNGPEGVLREVQDFARRRPGAFLVTALAAGFVMGRLGKSVARADATAGSEPKPDGDAFAASYSRPEPLPEEPDGGYTAPAQYARTGTPERAGGYPATEYASTGTGTPIVVDDVPPVTRTDPRP